MRATKLSSTVPSFAPRGAGPYCTIDRRVADDRADVEPVAMGDVAVDDAPDAVLARDDAAEAGIGRERRAALRDEVEAPRPGLVGQALVGRGRPHLGEKFVGDEAAAERDRHAVLRQHVERRVEAPAALDPLRRDRRLHRRGLDQLERVARHDGHARDAARRVAAAAGALKEPRDPFGRADLQHPLDRQEVDAEVEARGADDRLQRPVLQALLDPVARLARRASRDGARSRPAQSGRSFSRL